MAKDQGDAFSAGIKAAISRIEPTAPKSSAPDALDVIAGLVKGVALKNIKFGTKNIKLDTNFNDGEIPKCSDVVKGTAPGGKCYKDSGFER